MKQELRDWMFKGNVWDGEKQYSLGDRILGLHPEDYKAARRKLRQQFNKTESNKIFRAVMAMLDIPVDKHGSPVLKNLNIEQLVLLSKVGTKLGRAADSASNRIEQINRAKVPAAKEDKPVVSRSLKHLSIEELQKLHTKLGGLFYVKSECGADGSKLLDARLAIREEFKLRNNVKI